MNGIYMTEEQRRGKAIRQFMWEWQHFFRHSVENSLQRALEKIGFDGDPEVLVIGFDTTGEKVLPVCIEPENGSFGNLRFEPSIQTRAQDLFSTDPEQNFYISDPRLHRERRLHLFDRAHAKALIEALQNSGPGSGRTFFCSNSTVVAGYRVYVAVGIITAELSEVPQLKRTELDRIPILPSLVHAVVYEVLGRATRALNQPDPGKDLLGLDTGDDEIVRSATSATVRSVLTATGQIFARGRERHLNTISSLPYERRFANGRIVFSDAENPFLNVHLRLAKAVSLSDTHSVRKMLEASSSEVSLLSDGDHVYGFGTVKDDYDAETESIFVMTSTERGAWEVSHGDLSLFTVTDGAGRLSVSPLNPKNFADTVRRLIPNADISALLNLAEAASKNDHGAMLIISADAPGEAARLSPQAWMVTPIALNSGLAQQLTRIDGGILVDAHGKCHAIGVILDGTANGIGTPSRGSRFNNAVRYLDSSPPPTVVVVYSTDGHIDVLPKLMPQVERYKVSDALAAYVEIVSKEQFDFEIANRAWDKLLRFKFYLSDEQCEIANSARRRLEEMRNATSSIRISERDLRPNPSMNDSFWTSGR
ncbi:hypothetical protein AB0E59_38295 [Lentzea sp. NPDC034063]|uniref:hypothetical protein n=1 Tax=unclassified Lentzea TaxID=2643253 RepID=UPI0033FB41B2